MRVSLLIFCSALPLFAMAATDFDQQQILERIQPVGKVRVEGQDNTVKAAEPVKVAEKKEPGQATYEQYCAACHKDGIAGAPKFRDKALWEPRMAKQDIDSLTATAIKGMNAMPPKGTCADCSDAEIKAAIQYMLPKK